MCADQETGRTGRAADCLHRRGFPKASGAVAALVDVSFRSKSFRA